MVPQKQFYWCTWQEVFSLKYKKVCFSFHPLVGKPLVLPEKLTYFLQSLDGKVEANRLKAKLGSENIKALLEAGILVREKNLLRRRIQKRVKEAEHRIERKNPLYFLGFNVTDRCNLACKYCIKEYCDQVWRKSKIFQSDWHQVKKRIDDFVLLVQNNNRKNITIGFSGGEPLLDFELIRKIVGYIEKKLGKQKKINFVINTNGVLINQEIASFLAAHRFKTIGVSLDGLQEGHDAGRVYKNNQGTFQDVLQGLKLLVQNVPLDRITISTTLNKYNFEQLDVDFLDFLHQFGFRKLSLEPDIVDLVSLDYRLLAEKIFYLYQYGESKGILVDGYWRKPYRHLMEDKRLPLGSCYVVRGESLAIEPDGKVKPCIYSRESYSPSSLVSLFQYSSYRRFLRQKWLGEIEECRGCEIEGICGGACYLSRQVAGRRVFEYRCFLYRELTRKLIEKFLRENYHQFKALLQ